MLEKYRPIHSSRIPDEVDVGNQVAGGLGRIAYKSDTCVAL